MIFVLKYCDFPMSSRCLPCKIGSRDFYKASTELCNLYRPGYYIFSYWKIDVVFFVIPNPLAREGIWYWIGIVRLSNFIEQFIRYSRTVNEKCPRKISVYCPYFKSSMRILPHNFWHTVVSQYIKVLYLSALPVVLKYPSFSDP